MITKCLVYDPSKRITPEEALCHAWILEGLPANLQAQHLKIIQKEVSQKPSLIISDSSKRESREKVTIQDESKPNKEDHVSSSSRDNSAIRKKRDLQVKISGDTIDNEGAVMTISSVLVVNYNICHQEGPMISSATTKHNKPNTRNNSGMFIDSHNTNESIDNGAQKIHPMSTKNSNNINFISNIYYITPFGMQGSFMPSTLILPLLMCM